MRVRAFEMRAVREPLALVERQIAEPSATEVVVEVVGCGLCHTDLGFLDDGVPTRHPLPLVLGHEIVGRVVEAGSAARNRLGQNVIVPAVMACGQCALCCQGRAEICRAQIFPGCDVHGGFATHVLVPAHALCEVPKTLPKGLELAHLAVVADAVSTAFAAVKKSGLGQGSFAVVVGAGGVGGFAAQIAKARVAKVLALDVDESRLARLAEVNAVDATLCVRGMDPKAVRKAVREHAHEAGGGDTCWHIFETSGTAAGQETAYSLLTHGAVLSVVGFHAGSVQIKLSNLMAFAARAEGTWGCPAELFPACLELVLDGRVQLAPFVELFPMSQLPDVLDRARRHELTARPVLVPDQGMGL
jgi:6-hydroxycyclohex-1-ene-1-carbonyl-CoA dehydrogenase